MKKQTMSRSLQSSKLSNQLMILRKTVLQILALGNSSVTFSKNPKTLILDKMLHILGLSFLRCTVIVLCYKIFKVSSGSKIICYSVSYYTILTISFSGNITNKHCPKL